MESAASKRADAAMKPSDVYALAEKFALAVKEFCEEAPREWDGGDLGYDVGGLHRMSLDLLVATGYFG